MRSILRSVSLLIAVVALVGASCAGPEPAARVTFADIGEHADERVTIAGCLDDAYYVCVGCEHERTDLVRPGFHQTAWEVELFLPADEWNVWFEDGTVSGTASDGNHVEDGDRVRVTGDIVEVRPPEEDRPGQVQLDVDEIVLVRSSSGKRCIDQ